MFFFNTHSPDICLLPKKKATLKMCQSMKSIDQLPNNTVEYFPLLCSYSKNVSDKELFALFAELDNVSLRIQRMLRVLTINLCYVHLY